MPEPDRNAEALCSLINTWLATNELNAAWLVRQAGINPSILSRMLNRKTNLDESSALRLYRVMRWRMPKADQEAFLAAAGVLDLVQDAADSLTPQTSPPLDTGDDPQIMGMRLMLSGYSLLAAVATREAAAQFLKAEQAFGIASSNAPRAACEAINCLTNLGDIARAEQEILRVAGQYDHVMDPETRMYYSIIHGEIELDRGRLDEAEPWFTECLRIAEVTGIARLGDDALHNLGLIYLGRAQTAPIRVNIDVFLNVALSHFNKHLQHLQQRGVGDWNIAFEHLRLAQVQQLQGDMAAATASRRLARELFHKITALGAVTT